MLKSKSIKQAAIFLKDPFTLLLFLSVSFCFKESNIIGLSLFGIVTSIQIFRLFAKKINESVFFRTYFYLLIYATIFYGSIHKIILIILLLFFLQLLIKNKISSIIPNKINEWIFIGLFILIVINHCLFPPYFRGLDVFIYFLLIPLFFMGIKKLNLKVCITSSLKVFITSVFIVSVLLFIVNSIQGKLLTSTHTFFSDPIDLSHVYMGIFLGLANVFILILNSKNEYYINPVIDIVFLVFNSFLIAYIGARLALLAMFVVLFIFIYNLLKIKTTIKVSVIIILLTSLVFFSIKNSRFAQGTEEIKQLYTAIKTNDKESIIANSWRNMYMRYLVTTYTLEEIKEHWALGIGLQNVEKRVSQKIINEGYKHFISINTHNQYLHFLVGMGVIGLVYFLYLILYLLQHKNISVYFIMFLLLIMLTESVLVRGKGISIITFFSLLWLNKNPLHDNNSSHS